MPRAEISIVIGTYNRKKMLINCIDSIRNNDISVPYEIIVVDGGSEDGTKEWLVTQRDIITIIQHNRIVQGGQMVMKKSWGYFMNLGFKSAEGDYICMVSDDCYIHPDAIINGYELMESAGKKTGGCAFFFRDCLINDEFRVSYIFDKIYINHGIYRKVVLKEIGWIDEKNFQFYFADIDLTLRIWNSGHKIITSKTSLVEHLSHELDPIRSTNKLETESNKDFINLRNIWGKNYNFSKEKPIIGKVVLDKFIPNQLAAYLPKGLFYKILIFDRWLKTYIQKNSLIYLLLRKLKRIFFAKKY